LQEIETYLALLDVLEKEAAQGAPRIGSVSITAQQQKILYSSVYLQLYNLVEATVTWCVEAVCAAAADGGKWVPADLTETVRKEWVRATAKTHTEMTPENRLAKAVAMSERLVQALPVISWKMEVSGGGNWDDEDIRKLTQRLGCQLQISQQVYSDIKRPIKDNKGALVLVKDLRNRLAHGTLSFSECGEGVTVPDLVDLKERTAKYLREVVAAFTSFINSQEFLAPHKRPAPPNP
jgi:hypothetical protein